MKPGDVPPPPRRLSRAALAGLGGDIRRPFHGPATTRIGVLHFGPGAFHRAHQAAYLDDLLAIDPRWAICGVSLHSSAVRDALDPQDGLYTLALQGEHESLRVISSIHALLCAPLQQQAVLARLQDPHVRLVTLTITEKGYCLAGEDLDLAHPDIVHDLANPATPRSAIGYLVAGLAARRAADVAPFTVLSCDNLAGNGLKLRKATLHHARLLDPALAAWIEARVAFPCSMVDSITPATDEALRERVAQRLGCTDAWPIQRETYTQWVVEDRFCNDRPPLEQVGVTMSHDVAGHDRAKLRLLNGAHSTLAYLGLLLGLETVGDAMRHAPLARHVERLMRESIAPAIALPTDLDAAHYIADILVRFRNPAIRHRLSQIAWDGSQKIPVRLLGTIADALARGRDIAPLCLSVAAWMAFVRRQAREGVALVDPLDAQLTAIGKACTGDVAGDAARFLALDAVFAPLSADGRFRAAMVEACAALGDGSPAAVARALD
jgi:fructuronate reductase